MNKHAWIRIVGLEIQNFSDGWTVRSGVWWGDGITLDRGFGFYFCQALDYGQIRGNFLYLFGYKCQHRIDITIAKDKRGYDLLRDRH